MNKLKKCSQCLETKSLDFFYPRKFKSGNIGCRSTCKTCERANVREYHSQNGPKIYALRKLRGTTPKPKYSKERYKKHSKALRAYQSAWRIKNRDKIRKSESERRKIRAKVDKNYLLRIKISARISSRIKKGGATKGSLRLTGTSISCYRAYMESLFEIGMTWENYGEWHIDHIVPLSFFDLTLAEHQKMAFHFTNTRPMWKSENIARGNKMSPEEIEDNIDILTRIS